MASKKRSSPSIHIITLPASLLPPKPLRKPQKLEKMRGPSHPVTIRVQALSLMTFGMDIKAVEAATGMPRQTIQYWVKKARERGYNPEIDPRILPEHVEDAKRTGRPKEISEAIEQSVLASVQKDRNGREKSSEILAFEAGIPYSSVLRTLKKHGFSVVKPTTKPGLTDEMKQNRLAFCLAHKDWTLEDWKNVIFTDETSVCLGQRRGAVRVWRTKDESNEASCIRRRWKGYSDFMVWGAFTYDKKGPLHIWAPETAQDKKLAQTYIDQLNQELQPIRKQEWELNTYLARLKLRNGRTPSRMPTWRWTEKNGRLVRDSKGGIDWYRYQKEVLIPKLIPFAKECMIDRPYTIVLEDGAPAHRHHLQQTVYSLYEVQKIMDWPGNSPDLNAIEPCWLWLKKRTTARGAPRDKKTAKETWIKAWEELPQERIQQWIERLMRHIQMIIELGGGNEYKEGCSGKDRRNWKGFRLKGQLSKRQDISEL